MVTAEVEVRRRQLSLAAGVLFGLGWLLFIDAIVTYNGAAPFCPKICLFALRAASCLLCSGAGVLASAGAACGR